MRMLFLTITILIFSTGGSHCQNKYTKDQLANMVVYIIDQREGTHSIGLGTGVLVKDSSRYYLLTASHITDSIRGTCYLSFRIANDKSATIPLEKLTNNTKPLWRKHFEADISCVEIFAYDANASRRLNEWSFPKSQISCKPEPVSRDTDVTVVGYPVTDKIGLYFSPLTFTSHFSSGFITWARGDTRTLCAFQFLENPSVQGYSGGPVLIAVSKTGVSVGPKSTTLVGIVHGTLSDNTGGKLALITPGFYVCDLIK